MTLWCWVCSVLKDSLNHFENSTTYENPKFENSTLGFQPPESARVASVAASLHPQHLGWPRGSRQSRHGVASRRELCLAWDFD